MTYDATKLNLVSAAPLTGNRQQWTHESADAGAAVDTTGFITDAGKRGMKVGDVLLHENTSTKIVTSHRVMSLSTTYPYAADLSDTTTLVSGTNTD